MRAPDTAPGCLFPEMNDFDENKDCVLSQHARMLSVEIANRIHPSLDFFEEHLEEVKEYALFTIAQLEEVKMFLKLAKKKKKKSASNEREKSVFSEKKKKKKKKSKEQQRQRQQSFGAADDDDDDDEK